MGRAVKNLSHLTHMVAAESKQDTLPSCFSSHTVDKGPVLFGAVFFVCLCFLSLVSLFKMALKPSADALSARVQEGCDAPYRKSVYVR